MANDVRLVERFRREARTTSRVDHPNIVQIADFGRTDGGQFYLVMEHIPGVSLRAALDTAAPHRLPLLRSLGILAQITGAVAAAHEHGIIHRDLKPGNILIGSKSGGGDLVKILDFGLAKIMAEAEFEKLTKVGEIFGTPAYMSPEQGRGNRMDHRTDIYSLGIIAYELCAGRVPFVYNNIPDTLIAHQLEQPTPLSALIRPGEEDVPPDLEALIMLCLEKIADRRPQSAAELSRVIATHLERLPRFRVPAPTPVEVQQTINLEPDDPGLLEARPTLQTVSPAQQTILSDSSAPSLQTQEEQAHHEWLWTHVVKRARILAKQLAGQSVHPAEILETLSELAAIDKQVEELGTQVALAESTFEDQELELREGETRLRYAVVDLSIERGRLTDRGAANSPQVEDLDYQLRELETRLSELYKSNERQHQALERKLERKRERLDGLRKYQIDVEVRLVNALHHLRPQYCTPVLQSGYQKLDDSIRAWKH